jgi:ribonuclease HI
MGGNQAIHFERSQTDVNTGSEKVPQRIFIFIDAAIRPARAASGLAAIVRDETGRILYWWSSQAGKLTCNEAEYAAAIFALEQLQRLPGRKGLPEIELFSDSRVMVDQMSGCASAHALALRQARVRLQVLAARFRKVSFHHISREQNRLADALAFEAVSGAYQPGPKPVLECPYPDVWDQLVQLWSRS